jgi:hypothetical protein
MLQAGILLVLFNLALAVVLLWLLGRGGKGGDGEPR